MMEQLAKTADTEVSDHKWEYMHGWVIALQWVLSEIRSTRDPSGGSATAEGGA